ncbi:hypothetical protein AAU61_04215 [Desulfocarbo indianensis]|nr:hypothetical protein AAU61_04215 [Desulfocarbo indianensis]
MGNNPNPEAPSRPLGASLRLMDARERKPLSGRAPVGVRVLSRHGALLVLDTPFIDGMHVLMDVHNITRKLIQVFFPGENPETHEELSLLGEIESYQREEDERGVRFLLELRWLTDEFPHAQGERELKRLIRLIKKDLKTTGAR